MSNERLLLLLVQVVLGALLFVWTTRVLSRSENVSKQHVSLSVAIALVLTFIIAVMTALGARGVALGVFVTFGVVALATGCYRWYQRR
jgi:uncharacterized membrane protein YidH (DUF202 family)